MSDRKNHQSLFKFSFALTTCFILISSFTPLYAKKQQELFSPIFLNEGIRFYKSGDLKSAISSFSKSYSLSSTDISTLLLLSQAYIKDGKPELAVKTLQFAVKLYPNDALIHFFLGTAYKQINN